MPALMMKLTHQAEETLRRRFPQEEDLRWVGELAAREGWSTANRRYLESKREQGVQEMSVLMDVLGLSGITSDEEALELLATAVSVYLPEAEVALVSDEVGRPGLLIRVKECPTYARIEASDWHGVTACGSWHRRQGWYQALGVNAVDIVVGEKKWGDVACAALVKFPGAAPGERKGSW